MLKLTSSILWATFSNKHITLYAVHPSIPSTISTPTQNGGVLLDLGCGNGKYLGECEEGKTRFEVGADYSLNLLAIVRERGHQAVRLALLDATVKTFVSTSDAT